MTKIQFLKIVLIVIASLIIVATGYEIWKINKDIDEITTELTETIPQLKNENDIIGPIEEKNELNKPKPVGDFLLSVTDIRRIPNAKVRPYLTEVTNKDVLILDLLFIGGSNCKNGCYISTLINDYKLTTAEGLLEEPGEYSTKFYSAPFLDRKYSGNQALKPGEKGEDQAYFFIRPDDNDFIFTYFDAKSGESQSYRLKLE